MPPTDAFDLDRDRLPGGPLSGRAKSYQIEPDLGEEACALLQNDVVVEAVVLER